MRTLGCSAIEGLWGSRGRCCSPCPTAWTAWPATRWLTWASCALVYAVGAGAGAGAVAVAGAATVRLASLVQTTCGAAGGVGERRGTSVGGRSSEMTLGGRRARVRSRERRVAGGWGREGLSKCEFDAGTWVAAVAAEKRWRAVALSTRLCLLPIVSAQRAQDMAVGRGSTQQAASSKQQDKGQGAGGGTNLFGPGGVVGVPWPARSAGVHRCVCSEDSNSRLDWT